MSLQLVFAVMAGIGALIVVMALMSNRQPAAGDMELHMDGYNPEAGQAAKKGGLLEGFLEGFNKSLTRNKGGRTSKLTEELAKADLKLRVSEYVMVIVGLIVLLCAVLFIRFHNPILALILTFISPTYITPLFHEWLGYVLIGMGLVSIAIGYGIISKITNIQV